MKTTRFFNWERMPWSFFQFPMGIVWAWYCLRSRSLWFFTSSNPSIEFGGFEGEGKREIYAQMPAEVLPRTVFVQPGLPFSEVKTMVETEKFTFPLAVKPDVGMKGLLFRRIESLDALEKYHQNLSNTTSSGSATATTLEIEYMLQEWVDLPLELSVFYVRHPRSERGAITGMTWKQPIEVVGDGTSTLENLMLAEPRAVERLAELKNLHRHALQRIVPPGEKFLLTHAANRHRGARLHNLQAEIDAPLVEIFDKISHHAGQFFWGRYDLKCQSIEDLRAGKNFKILEFNGAGAAPNHIYHAGLSFVEAWREVVRNWRALFEISRFNFENGVPRWSFLKGWKYLLAARRRWQVLEKLELEI